VGGGIDQIIAIDIKEASDIILLFLGGGPFTVRKRGRGFKRWIGLVEGYGDNAVRESSTGFHAFRQHWDIPSKQTGISQQAVLHNGQEPPAWEVNWG
jgi:hypothetical protein